MEEEVITCHKNAPMSQLVREWHWEKREGNSFRSCPYCGSVHPDDLLEALNKGARLGGSDWKYGYPHKFYIDGGLPNMIKFYTRHLLDLDNESFARIAPLLTIHTGIEFSRDEKGETFYKAPYHGYQR